MFVKVIDVKLTPHEINFSLNAQNKHWRNRFVIDVVGDVVTLTSAAIIDRWALFTEARNLASRRVETLTVFTRILAL